MAPRLPRLLAFAVCVLTASALALLACKSEGPGAPPRKNGCIDTGCAPVTTAAPPGSSTDAGRGTGATTTASWDPEDVGGDALDDGDDDAGPGLP